jgi:chromosome segregation ATPase
MKKSIDFDTIRAIIITITICLGALLVYFGVYTMDVQHSKQLVEKVEAIEHLDDRAEQAEKYSLDLLDVVKSLSHENTILCERDAKTFQVVAEFEDENRRLKGSLSDAVLRLKDQETEINSLIDQNTDLEYEAAEFEGENCRLKGSLSDAVTKLKDQQTAINSLIDQNTDLRHKVKALEALDTSHPNVEL